MKRGLFLSLLLSAQVTIMLAGPSEVECNSVFSLGFKDVVSMYADDRAFYLHTEDVVYTVSREGEVLSADSSKVKYGCFEGAFFIRIPRARTAYLPIRVTLY